MMAAVSLRDMVDELQIASSDEIHVYLNKITGKVLSVTNDDFAIVEYEDESEFPETDDAVGGDDLEKEFFMEVKRIAAFDEDYLELPSKIDINEYEIMERFGLSYPDRRIGDMILDKIRGSGAFRRFKDIIYEYGIEKKWFIFLEEAYKEISIEWLQRHGLAYVDDMNRGVHNI
jgi:hypothetical protein